MENHIAEPQLSPEDNVVVAYFPNGHQRLTLVVGPLQDNGSSFLRVYVGEELQRRYPLPNGNSIVHLDQIRSEAEMWRDEKTPPKEVITSIDSIFS